MSKSSKLKKRLAVATAALTLAVPAIGLAAPITPPSGGGSTPVTPTVNPPSAATQIYSFNVSYNTFTSISSAMNLLNAVQPFNFLGWNNNSTVPLSNQGSLSQSLGGNGGTNTGLISTGGGSYDPLSSLKSINDHVVVVQTSTKPKRASTGNVKIDQAKTEQTEAAKKLLETAKSGNKDEIKKATEELQKKNDELQKVREQEQNNKANQEALEKSLKDAQEAAKKVEEARAKAELAARDYLNALKTGDPEIIAAYKERLQEANDAYLAARQNEEAQINNAINPYTIGGVYNNLTGTPEPGQQGGEQQDNSAESGGFPSLSELLRQYQEQQQQQQQSGETTIVTVGEPQESDALKRINDLIGKELIERETNARNKLVKAKTSEERQQAMKELDEIHRLETEKVQKAQAEQNILNLEMKIKEPNWEMDGPRLITEPVRAGEGTQGEPVKPGDYQEWLEQNKDNLSSQQGEQRTSVETGGQSGLNIGGGETTMTEQKSAEQSAKDAAVKAAQENLDQIRKEGFDAYAALQKAQYDLSAAEDKAEQAANDYLLALKSGDKDTIAAFKEELQKANDALLEAKRNEEAAQQGLKEAGSNIARAQTELNNAQNNFNDSGAAGGETQQTTQQAVEQPTQQQTVEQQSQSQQGEQRTSVVETGGQGGLNIGGGERPVVETETTRPRTGASQQTMQGKISALEQQKFIELDKKYQELNDAIDKAGDALLKAYNSGASQEELDRLDKEYDQLWDKRDLAFLDESVNKSDYLEWREQNKQQNQSQQGGSTSVVETGGQSGLNIGGGERPVVETETTRPRTGTSQQSMQGNLSTLEQQKFIELDKKYQELNDAIDKAGDALLKAYNSGASQEELDRLDKEYDQLWDKRDLAFLDESVNKSDYLEWREQNKQQNQSQQGGGTSVVETGGQSGLNIGGGERPVVETETTRPRTGTSQQTTQEKVSVLEQKYKELDETVGKLVSDITAADVAYMKAKDAGASQEELDRLKAERAQIANKRDAIWEERDAAEAELKAARAKATAAE